MNCVELIPYWIEGPEPTGPIGFGVTAFSREDAFSIIQRAGYELPDDLSKLNVRVGINPEELDNDVVRTHMGPIVVRGLWYPFIRVGLGSGWPAKFPGMDLDRPT